MSAFKDYLKYIDAIYSLSHEEENPVQIARIWKGAFIQKHGQHPRKLSTRYFKRREEIEQKVANIRRLAQKL